MTYINSLNLLGTLKSRSSNAADSHTASLHARLFSPAPLTYMVVVKALDGTLCPGDQLLQSYRLCTVQKKKKNDYPHLPYDAMRPAGSGHVPILLLW